MRRPDGTSIPVEGKKGGSMLERIATAGGQVKRRISMTYDSYPQ
jgi:hypothetical protein